MVLITYINNSGTYVGDFLYIVVNLFCYIVQWNCLILEEPETIHNLFFHKELTIATNE
jgi:hypothetical protein